MGKKTKKPGRGKDKTERKTAKAEEKRARRETRKVSAEDDIDAILRSIQKEEAKKKEVHVEENVPAPSPRSNCSVKKSGMPPRPRAGFSMCVHKKRALLFGGVIDMEAEGDVLMSLFMNDLYGFQLDSHRWYPLELRKDKSAKDKVQGCKRNEPIKDSASSSKDRRDDIEMSEANDGDEQEYYEETSDVQYGTQDVSHMTRTLSLDDVPSTRVSNVKVGVGQWLRNTTPCYGTFFHVLVQDIEPSFATKELRKDGFDLAEARYKELKPILDEVNLASALGGSISFGKYLSESLDWGKWSSFSHNRYLEDVEKYSKPGSVAQKKAYFEAHYRNMAARKSVSVLDHENAITATAPEREASDRFSNDEGHIDSSDPEVGSKEVKDIMTTTEAQEIVSVAVDAGSSGSAGGNHAAGTGQVEKAGQILEDEILKGSCSQIESTDIVEDVENQNKVPAIEPDTSSPSEKQPLKESFVTNKDSVDSVEMKSRGPVSKSSVRRSSRLPPSPATKPPFSPARTTPSIHRIKENNSTPSGMRKRGTGSTETKKSTPKSLHMSINITQYQSGATTTSGSTSSSFLEKVANSKAASVIPKASQECSHHFRTPTKASSNGVTKLVPLTPLSEHGSYSKSSSIKGRRQCSPLASSFCFKTQQRAEKRKELFHNLEDKFDKKGAKKLQLQEASKEKAESESRKLRQSLCFKARPLPDFYRNIEPPKVEMRKEKDENELKKLHQSLCFKARPLPDFYHNIKPTKFDMKKLIQGFSRLYRNFSSADQTAVVHQPKFEAPRSVLLTKEKTNERDQQVEYENHSSATILSGTLRE
ncbi:putative protein WVD2-like 7 [Cocos nucifera]|nr:putative protein WVD2-like 7 [Cocos nucifera]